MNYNIVEVIFFGLALLVFVVVIPGVLFLMWKNGFLGNRDPVKIYKFALKKLIRKENNLQNLLWGWYTLTADLLDTDQSESIVIMLFDGTKINRTDFSPRKQMFDSIQKIFFEYLMKITSQTLKTPAGVKNYLINNFLPKIEK